MTYDLTKLPQYIEEMRERLRQMAITEQSLVKDLADTLDALDHQLLQNIHKVSAEHQVRRGTIFNELQALADSIGRFRSKHEAGAIPQRVPQQIDYGHQYAPADWRQATETLSLQDKLESHLRGLNGKSPKN